MQNAAVQHIRAIKNLLHALGTRDDGACNDVAMSTDVFRRRVYNDVDAVSNGFLKEWRCPAVVDTCQRTVLACDSGNSLEIECSKQHRSRILEPDELRVGLESVSYIVSRKIEKQRMLDAELLQMLRQLKRRSVRVIHKKDVIAGTQQAHDHSAHSRDARAKSFASITAFQRGKLAFQNFY